MIIIWIIFVCSVVLLPATALLALRWSARHGAFDDFQKTALSIFDEEEPVGRMSDRFPGGDANKNNPQS
jgi:cbb3-type cytochrome oxidase maturation protein